MINIFSGETADEVWLKAATRFRDNSGVSLQTGRNGKIEEILHSVISIEKPRQRWVMSREPALNPAFALAEIIWILNGSQDSSIINFWNPRLPRFAGKGETYHGAYGYRLRNHFGLDQLDKAYHALKSNPGSRQVVIQIWDPRVDLPGEDGSPVSEDIPCNLSGLLKLRDNKLEWMQIIRSNDIFRGMPYNVVQFTTLQEVMAGWLGVELGSYNQVSDSLHLYESDKKKPLIRKCHSHAIVNNDSLLLPKEESEYFLKEVFNKMKVFSKPDVSESVFDRATNLPKSNRAFQNILFVIAADAARRKGWHEYAKRLIKKCSNQAFLELWTNWSRRCHQVTESSQI